MYGEAAHIWNLSEAFATQTHPTITLPKLQEFYLLVGAGLRALYLHNFEREARAGATFSVCVSKGCQGDEVVMLRPECPEIAEIADGASWRTLGSRPDQSGVMSAHGHVHFGFQLCGSFLGSLAQD